MFDIVSNDRQLWTATVEKFAKCDVYHSYDYHSMCCQAQKAQSFHLLHLQYEDCSAAFPFLQHKLTGDLQSTFDFRSVYGYPSPLFSGNWTADTLRRCWAEFIENYKPLRVLSISSRVSPYCDDRDIELLSSIGTITPVGDIVVMPANNPDSANLLTYRSNHRRNIRTLKKKGIVCRRVYSQDHRDRFSQLYRVHMKDAEASDMYMFNEAYFYALNAAKNYECRLYACFDGEDVICAGYFLFGKHNAHYHLGATAHSHRHMAPSKLLFDTVYHDCIRDGFQTLNLGGGVGGSDDSLLRFKLGFSSTRLRSRMFHATVNEELELSATKAREAQASTAGLVLDESYVPRYRASLLPANEAKS